MYHYQLENRALRIVIPEEYFFPVFTETAEYLFNTDDYRNAERIIVDFTNCQYMHGIGMGGEVQLFYQQAKEEGKSVYWLGNRSLYDVLCMINDGNDCPVLPYIHPETNF